MLLLFASTTLLLLFLCYSQYKKMIRQANALSYISDTIELILLENRREFIMFPTDNSDIKKIASSLNHLLEAYYTKQTEYGQSKKMMHQVLTNISHDIKTPLTVIKGYAEMLQIKGTELMQNQETVKVIRRLDEKAGELVRIVTQFFNMAKLKSQDAVLKLEPLDIHAICRKAMFEFYDLLEKDNVHVFIGIPDKPLLINTDEDALLRILRNLIDNAMKYGKAGGYLGITVSENPKDIRIAIEDHGQGLAEKEQELIFNRSVSFGRKSGNSQGSGLGLAICKNLAEQMGYSIQVDSRPGLSTIFTILMPKSRETADFHISKSSIL